MNEKLQYAEMLEIPINTCNIVYKPSKKKKSTLRKEQLADKLKEEIIEKVNAESDSEEVSTQLEENQVVEELPYEYQQDEEESTAKISVKKSRVKGIKFPFKTNVIALQLIAIGVLLATIFLTNSLVPNSGINTFMKNLFGKDEISAVSSVNYQDFSPSVPMQEGANIVLNEGVMTLTAKGSVYSPCDGKIASIQSKDGKYLLEIVHGENFKTVFSGIDYAYGEVGDLVFATIPVGYVMQGGSTACFTDASGEMIKDYTILNNQVVWAV